MPGIIDLDLGENQPAAEELLQEPITALNLFQISCKPQHPQKHRPQSFKTPCCLLILTRLQNRSFPVHPNVCGSTLRWPADHALVLRCPWLLCFGSLASARAVTWNASMSGHVCRQQLTLTRKRPHVCTPEPVGCSCLVAQAAAAPKFALALPKASTQLIQFVMWNATTCGRACRQQLTLTRKRPDVCTSEPVGGSCLFAQTAADPRKLASALPEASTSTQLIRCDVWNASTCGHVCRQQLTLTRERPDVSTPEPVGCSCLFAQTAGACDFEEFEDDDDDFEEFDDVMTTLMSLSLMMMTVTMSSTYRRRRRSSSSSSLTERQFCSKMSKTVLQPGCI